VTEPGHGTPLPDADRRRHLLRVVMPLAYLAVAGLGLLIAWLGGVETIWQQGAAPWHWAHALLVGAAAGGLVAGWSAFASRRWSWSSRMSRAFGELLGPIDLLTATLVALSSGIAEELLFRGALQPLIGLVPASLLFGVLHVAPGRAFRPWTVFALLMGFGLGGLALWTGQLIAPIACHVTVNWLNLLDIERLRRADEVDSARRPGEVG
jgi:uncharacterized protein